MSCSGADQTWRVDGVELIGGPEKRAIVIEPYSPRWPQMFDEHRHCIARALGEVARRVDHVGSTAVVGLAAKPIIDSQVSVPNVEDESSYLPQLEAAGYRLRVREAAHRMLRTLEMDVHLHVCDSGSDWERRHLLLRDWLRESAEDREAYARLKIELQREEWESMNHYAEAKSNLIAEMTNRAEQWAAETRWSP